MRDSNIYEGYDKVPPEEENNSFIGACIMLVPFFMFLTLIVVSFVRWVINAF